MNGNIFLKRTKEDKTQKRQNSLVLSSFYRLHFINVNLDKEKPAQTFYRRKQHLLLYQFNVCFVVISNVFVDV